MCPVTLYEDVVWRCRCVPSTARNNAEHECPELRERLAAVNSDPALAPVRAHFCPLFHGSLQCQYTLTHTLYDSRDPAATTTTRRLAGPFRRQCSLVLEYKSAVGDGTVPPMTCKTRVDFGDSVTMRDGVADMEIAEVFGRVLFGPIYCDFFRRTDVRQRLVSSILDAAAACGVPDTVVLLATGKGRGWNLLHELAASRALWWYPRRTRAMLADIYDRLSPGVVRYLLQMETVSDELGVCTPYMLAAHALRGEDAPEEADELLAMFRPVGAKSAAGAE